VDSIDLIMSERSGVEIDYCPQCRGVWLDRGELDKIIDRAAESLGPAAAFPVAPPTALPPTVYPAAAAGPIPPPLYNLDPRRDDRRPDDRRYDDRRYDERRDRRPDQSRPEQSRTEQSGYQQPRYDDRRRPKKKESWLGDLFDF
jgi:Zn-finger nucleic acid-binding protein